MHTLQAACLNRSDYCKFPEGIGSIGEFVAFLNEHYHSFVALEVFTAEGGTQLQYWNPARIQSVTEANVPFGGGAARCEACAHYYAGVCEENLGAAWQEIDPGKGCSRFEKSQER